jgi:hypothetical protein
MRLSAIRAAVGFHNIGLAAVMHFLLGLVEFVAGIARSLYRFQGLLEILLRLYSLLIRHQ